MRPTFTTEIGRMRAEEMRQRAERQRSARLAKAAASVDPGEENVVITERQRPFSLRRIFAFATGAFGLMVVLASSAMAMPVGPGSGGAGGGGVAPVDTVEVVTPVNITPFVVAAAVVLAVMGAWYLITTRYSSPRVA